MHRKSSLSDLPFVEFWLIPTIFVLIVCALELIDSPPACGANCGCAVSNP